MKKGRHRRFEEARALKRSQEVDLEDLFESINDDDKGEHKPEHDAWADLAEEWESQSDDPDDESDQASSTSDTADDDATKGEGAANYGDDNSDCGDQAEEEAAS